VCSFVTVNRLSSYLNLTCKHNILHLPCTTRCIQDLTTTFSSEQFYDPLPILTSASLLASYVRLPNTRSFAVGVLIWDTFCCYSKRTSTVDTVDHNVQSATCQVNNVSLMLYTVWLGSIVVRALDLQSTGYGPYGFDSRPRHCRVAILDKSFTRAQRLS